MSEEALRQLRRGNTQGAIDLLVQEVTLLREQGVDSGNDVDYIGPFYGQGVDNGFFRCEDASVGNMTQEVGTTYCVAVLYRRDAAIENTSEACIVAKQDGTNGWALYDEGDTDPTGVSLRFEYNNGGIAETVTGTLTGRTTGRWILAIAQVTFGDGAAGIRLIANGEVIGTGNVVTMAHTNAAVAMSVGADYNGIVAATTMSIAAVGFRTAEFGDATIGTNGNYERVFKAVTNLRDLPSGTYWNFLTNEVTEYPFDHLWSVKRSAPTLATEGRWANQGAAATVSVNALIYQGIVDEVPGETQIGADAEPLWA